MIGYHGIISYHFSKVFAGEGHNPLMEVTVRNCPRRSVCPAVPEKKPDMNKKAVVLMSGGLDSSLAVRMIHDMGIEIVGVHFTGPFCQCNRGKGGCISYAMQQAESLGIEFRTLPLGGDYIDIVIAPRHGYGSGANPCMDCRILMFRRARQLMIEVGASFVVTGEVLGQRPMSQLKDKLAVIEKESGLQGLIVRPLCGQHMPETLPEKEGILDREKMMAISGRSRREQIDLAAMLEVGDYPCPAGGCLLTEKPFARRIKDAIAHEELRLESIALLKIGRHFRLPGGSKLVVGRDQQENEKIERLAGEDDTVLVPDTVNGPSALLRGVDPSKEDIELAASVVASYCSGEGTTTIRVAGTENMITVERRDRSSFDSIRI
jgi:tRNA-specific 2-thiouridylase